jgi:tRNA(Ile)-lysidine synthetase-like protein
MIKCSREIINKAVELNGIKEYVLMCSSGVDSIAGVHYLLSKVNKRDRNRYKVFHFNHRVRPQNDKMEESFYNFMDTELPSFYKTVIVRNDDNIKSSETTEAKLRDFRLKKMMEFIHRNVIVTFHHLNDCVESYLLNCIRGHDSYQPIPFWTEWNQDTTSVSCHPFLFTKKQDFIDYCVKHDLMKYVVEDETNVLSKGSRRNMIRNEIIPILERDKVGLETIVSKKMHKRLMVDLLK